MVDSDKGRLDWEYLLRLAALKALFYGDGDKEFWRRVLRNESESTPAPASSVKERYVSPNRCSGGCSGNKTGCPYSHCWG
ncbi:hypothetical protein ACWCYZ_23950 [Streptomyces virginiae]